MFKTEIYLFCMGVKLDIRELSGHIKVKLSLVLTAQASGVECRTYYSSYSFLTAPIDGDEWSLPCPPTLNPRKRFLGTHSEGLRASLPHLPLLGIEPR
jgi:hypothetical protein